jgi:putative membrane protein
MRVTSSRRARDAHRSATDARATSAAEMREPDPRFTFANERTFLAWNRTALALMAGALAVMQLLSEVGPWERLAIAAPLVILSAAIALTSHGRWRTNQLALRRGERLPSSALPLILAIGVAVDAVIAGVVLLVGLATR